mmetsp:Transcript_27394/g.109723  ORF Transcript_27394/g.109723 Transcript_27394/m.109723 type:complete len:122 (-) Transcript_27394:935-1300(-)
MPPLVFAAPHPLSSVCTPTTLLASLSLHHPDYESPEGEALCHRQRRTTTWWCPQSNVETTTTRCAADDDLGPPRHFIKAAAEPDRTHSRRLSSDHLGAPPPAEPEEASGTASWKAKGPSRP